jgi:hypothetical protein
MFSGDQLHPGLAFISFAALLINVGCSPSSPSCDPRGSTAPDQLIVTCTSVGSDVQCGATATNRGDLYICTAVNQIVTNLVTWSSSDPSVGTFGVSGLPAGYLKTVNAGWVEIDARYGSMSSLPPIAYAVAPGSPPEQLVQLALIVQDAATSQRLVGVKMDISSARFATQSCVSSGTGSCVLWVLKGDVRVTATQTGYQDAVVAAPVDSASALALLTVKMTTLPHAFSRSTGWTN